MPTEPDDVSKIVGSGREIHRGDCEILWGDLIDGRRSWQETSDLAKALMSTANVPNPIVNGGLLSLYYLWQEGVARDSASQVAARERWRQALRDQDLDRDGWYRRHYQSLVRDIGEMSGRQRAEHIGTELVGRGLLAQADVAAVLAEFEHGK